MAARVMAPSATYRGVESDSALKSTVPQQVVNDGPTGEAFPAHSRFEILRELGRGGMGIVYEARDRELDVKVALKTLAQPNPDGLLRFKKEFRAVREVRHSNLVRLGELVGGPPWFFTMELVHGIEFASYVRRTVEPGLAGSSDATLAPVGAWRFDEQRLRRCFRQLADGLIALHSADKVHRDVKSSNVLVTAEGRVVLLDFGLVLDTLSSDRSSGAKVLGTVAYMAPEQAAALPLGPPADWYAAGVILYEALTGHLPFDGHAIAVMLEKQRTEPLPPRHHVPSLPADLNDLCVALLRLDPAARPDGAEVLRRLGDAPAAKPRVPERSTFVGRAAELETLAKAFAETRRGFGQTVFVIGESGIGKTALVREFVDARRREGALVLAGRCSQQESVPFRAFDGVVDALSRELRALVDVEVAALLPRTVSLLTQLFPVLLRVDIIARAPQTRVDASVASDARARAFLALRELLARLADRRPLIIVIDDLQWADADSLALLEEVMRAPEAPPLLLLGISRAPLKDALAAARLLQLEGLEASDAQELAARLLAGTANSDDWIPLIAQEANGHPLFLDELARHMMNNRADSEAPVRLEDALGKRLSQLAAPLRQMLELTVVAGAPLEQSLLASAANAGMSELVDGLETLRAMNLVRTSGLQGADLAEPFHDRVRDAVLAHLSPERRRSHHGRLAVILMSSKHAPAEALAIHWHGAGDTTQAAEHMLKAAEQADSARAFHRAARLYGLVRDLLPDRDDATLKAKLGWALVNAGRGVEAADIFLALSTTLAGDEALAWRGRAAEQFLRGGRSDRGLAVLADVMKHGGLTLPMTNAGVMRAALVAEARLRLRGLKPSSSCKLSAAQYQTLQMCRMGTFGLADSMRGMSFASRRLTLELDAAEPEQLVSALALASHFEAMKGPTTEARVAQFQRVARATGQLAGTPLARAWAEVAEALPRFWYGQWRDALEYCERASRLLDEECTGVASELKWIRSFELGSLWYLGDMRELIPRATRYSREASLAGDVHGLLLYQLGEVTNGWIAIDEPVEALKQLESAVEGAVLDRMQYARFCYRCSRVQLALYSGDAEQAYHDAGDFDRSLAARAFASFFRGAGVRISELRARAALAMIAASGQINGRLLRTAAANLDYMVKYGAAHSVAMARLHQGRVAALLGHHEESVRLVTIAAQGFAAVDMPLYQAVALKRQGAIMGGAEGEVLEQKAVADMTRLGVKSPTKMASFLAP